MRQKVLIVEDNVVLSQLQKEWLEKSGYEVVTAMNEPIARRLIRKQSFDLILSDVRLPEGNGISLLEWLNKEKSRIPFVIMTEYASFSDAVHAVKLGAKDYLPKPVHKEKLLELVREFLKALSSIREEKVILRRNSPKAKEVERLALLAAPSDISVMILGANGTGKESVAQSIHQKRTYPPVGSHKELIADVRIFSATNEDLCQAISEKRFREDLYHRLCEFELCQPSLSECPEDILPFAEFFREVYF